MEKIFMGIGYLGDGILFGTAVYLFFCAIFYIRKGEVRCFRDWWFLEYFFFIYLGTVGYVTRVLDVSAWSFGGGYGFNLIPWVNESKSLMVLNFCLFLPMGIFLPIVLRKISWSVVKITAIGGLISIGIEIIQVLFAGRMGDIDDIIFNTAGCLAGGILWKLCNGFFTKREYSAFAIKSWCFIALTALLGIPFYQISIGDLILEHWGIPSWSGNTEYIMAFQGIHYTLLPCILAAAAIFLTAYRNKAKKGRISVMAGSGIFLIYFVVSFI